MSKLLPLTVTITLFSMGYLSSQERSGLTEKQIRKIVREEIQKAAKVRATRPVVVLPSAGIQAPGFSHPIPKGARFWTPQAITFSDLGPSPASRAIAAAEKAVEADKTLSKRQRVAALKALDAAHRAIEDGRKAKQRARKRASKKPGKGASSLRLLLMPSIKPKAEAQPTKKYRWVIPRYEIKTLPSFRGSRSDLYFDGDASKTLQWETAPAKKHNLLLRTGEKGLHYSLSTPPTDSRKKADFRKKADSKKKAAPKKAKRPARIHI